MVASAKQYFVSTDWADAENGKTNAVPAMAHRLSVFFMVHSLPIGRPVGRRRCAMSDLAR